MPLTSILEILAEAEVEFILVGGLAAVAQGAPITTFDVDIVHRREVENVRRLLAVLASIHARHRAQPALSDRAVRVLGLDKLIELKRASTHPKDVRTLQILLDLQRRRS